jgi:nucleoside phosphorylase
MIDMDETTAPAGSPRLPAVPVLLTAATRWESRPLAAALGLTPAGDARWEGRLAGRPVTLVQTGIGAERTAAALGGGVSAADYGLALSAGLCGALQEDLRGGDLVADAGGAEMDFVAPLRETAKALRLPLHFGRILHTNVVLQPDAKRRLGAEHRAVACDMETQAVRRWAHGTALTVLGVRAVLDRVDDALPADSPDGEDAAAMARYALSRPGEIPRLLRTGLACGRAMKGLGRFLKAYLETAR